MVLPIFGNSPPNCKHLMIFALKLTAIFYFVHKFDYKRDKRTSNEELTVQMTCKNKLFPMDFVYFSKYETIALKYNTNSLKMNVK